MRKIMSCWVRIIVLAVGFALVFSSGLFAQEDSGWRISPEKINVQAGTDRRLQLLDDSAQELHDAAWSVSDPELADIQEIDGRMVVHSKAVGTVRVSATLGQQTRFRDIKIWPASEPMPVGTTNWGIHPIGREIRDLPAVPTGDGPTELALEETPSGSTYLRGNEEDGIQAWTWLMPDKTSDVEMVCGDWFGGALISANHPASYTLYAVGKDGKLRWRLTVKGHRKGLAISTAHMIYLLSESVDGTASNVKGLDEFSGEEKFDLSLPASREVQVNVKNQGEKLVCIPGEVSKPSQIHTSRMYVNMDGYAYIAFSQNEWTLEIAKCAAGSTLDPNQVNLVRAENVMLWQIHPDGTYRSTTVESVRNEQSASAPVNVASPTGALVTDNHNGLMIPIRLSHDLHSQGNRESANELVYRMNPDGDVLYKLQLPKYTGPLDDEMVIGSGDVAFATRGGVLIAFDLNAGKELWRWDSKTPEISVFAALANGDCLIQTPTALVEVMNSTNSKELGQGKFMMDWQGRMYRLHK
jgi:outer membrane protein assembly factor BamB